MNERSQLMRLLIASSIAITFMLADFQYQQFDRFRLRISKIVYPLQMIVDAPFSGYEQFTSYMQSRTALQHENAELQKNNMLLHGNLQKLLALEIENNRLRELLNSTASRKDKLSVASVLHIEPDPFKQQIILDKGETHGVYLGQPIVDASGVVGAIVSIDSLTSRALLITDINFAVPVENTRNGLRAIAIGTGDRDIIELQHVPNTVDMAVGDLLITSGFGGRYPFGYQVGVVSTVERDPGKPFATIKVQPKADLARCREILLVSPNQNESEVADHAKITSSVLPTQNKSEHSVTLLTVDTAADISIAGTGNLKKEAR